MIVLDTHVWVWWLVAQHRLSRRARRAIETADRLGVATISVFELVGLADKSRIELHSPPRRWIRDALAADRVERLPLTVDVAIDAAQLRFAEDPFDRIIYATARAEDAQLVTRDERMHAFDPERAVW